MAGRGPASVAGILRKDGRIFIARRLPGGALGEKWEFPGGKVEPGESDREALIREFREEFGLAVTAGELLAEAEFEHRGLTRCLRAYGVSADPGAAAPELREHTEWAWAGFGEIAALDFAPSDRKLLPALEKAGTAP